MGFSTSISITGLDLFPIRARDGVSPNMAIGAMSTRPALLIKVRDKDGCFGWGEVWANFPPRANVHKAHLIEDVVVPKVEGVTFVEPREAGIFLRETLGIYFLHIGQAQVFEHILAGIDTALWDLTLRKSGKTFAEHMGYSRTSAPTYASSINGCDIERLIPGHARMGQTHFKLKIGFIEDGDNTVVEQAANLLPEGA